MFCSSLYCILFINGISKSKKSLNFLSFYTFGGISSRPAALLFLIFDSTTLSSSWVSCSNLMSRWLLIILVIGSSVTLEEFPSKLLKCSFHICIRSSWRAAFIFPLRVLFRLLTSFTVCYAIHDCLLSTEFLILLIWPWISSFFFFFCYMLDCPHCAFLCFCVLTFFGFLILHKDVVFTVYSFILTANVFHGTLCLALGLVGIHSAASMCAFTKFYI